MANREMYARCAQTQMGVEFIAGLEMRDGEEWESLSEELRRCVRWEQPNLAAHLHLGYSILASAIENEIKRAWPDRAYFIEVGVEDKWCQIFQPFGVPRVAASKPCEHCGKETESSSDNRDGSNLCWCSDEED